MAEIRVCAVAELGDPGRKVVDVNGQEIGVFRLGDEIFAYLNSCPHLDGPVCQGKILPLALEAVADDLTSSGRVFSKTQMNVICPWHGFEFDIRTGEHPTNKRIKLRKVKAQVVDGDIYVAPPAPRPVPLGTA